MHAAVLHEHGATPRSEAFEEPIAADGQAVVEVAVAGVNPVDVRKASGTFVSGPPPLPSVVGTEGVGRVAGDGRRVYFDVPVAPFGSFAERALVAADAMIELPDAVDDGVATALGIAGLAGWLPLAWRAQLQPGETVLVLGATGVVGQIALQAARLLGAGRVVAAGRDPQLLERALQLGADSTVDLTGSPSRDDLAAAFREAAGGDIDVVHDPLWGEPAAAAVEALAFRGRLVQLGQSAGAEATFSSLPIRGRMLDIRGYMNGFAPADVRRDAYRTLVDHAVAGQIAVDVERIPLADVADAWERVQRSAHRKLVLVP
ncbi:MAG TPA: zinc-binding alcohol dehydrogenase family protein [Conexibacter sp.]|jgi:NADPH:quinone reductase-like Zn-dependent oxidoreductase|nr:zinc-binding alcohol dehydrogenase family protein [Conexibacter sp.]